MESLNQRKRKAKGKWFGNSKKAKYAICPGQKGFLVFCNNREREAIKEARILFDEFMTKTKVEEVSDDENLQKSEDEFDAVEAEKAQMDHDKSEAGEKFKLMNTGVQNVLFFKARIHDPVSFAKAIMDEIIESKEQKTRFLLRLIPIEATTKAYKENISEAVKKLLIPHFDGKELSYCVVFKSRCNKDFSKEVAYKIVGDIMKEISPNSKVEFKTPDFVVMVEVMKGNCCIGVLPDYFSTYKKYNLIELASLKVKETAQNENSQEKDADKNTNETKNESQSSEKE